MAIIGSGKYRYEITGKDWGDLPEGWTYKEATAVAVDAYDNVYVFNRGGHPIIKYDRNGKFIKSWGEGIFTVPHGVAMGPDDTIFCIDNGDHTVRKFTLDGKLLFTLGEPGKPAPAMSGKPFCLPTHAAVDPRNGNLYVSDGYGNAKVHQYTPDGRYVTSWGESGTDPGCFNIVHNISIDRDGYIYIGDRENHRVQVFDSKGKFQQQWVNMSKCAAVCVDNGNEDVVYVGEYFAGIKSNITGTNLGPRVTVMDRKGKVLARCGEYSYGEDAGRFYAPHGIACDSHGDIYVAEVAYSEIGRLMTPPTILRSLQKLVRVR
ncbi:MAG: hypothetical protein FJ319_04420 [SAR202 cluster bacterium]|nr:hypothetical protein [SAR202 cluster bacterium]